ncbi:MAG: hypothetical protein R8G66_33685 [Cytophagales bacterium]|nr:hypothetical protein [Cytophagales bacterium]
MELLKPIYSRFIFMIVFLGLIRPLIAQNQTLPTVAVLGVESNGISNNADAVSYMVRLEIEKLNVYYIMDKYDVAEVAAQNNIDVANCFGKNCVTAAGKSLNVDKVISGSVDRFGEKVIISLKLYDVNTGTIEKQSAMEYLNLQSEIQRMIRVSVKKLLNVDPDPAVMNLLVNYDVPVENPLTKLSLNGPRMGFSVPFGETQDILTSELSEGGFDMYPAMFQFGWQQEEQYLSAGNFQALIEGILLFGGLESGRLIPSLSILNGFRFGKAGWEFGFGPSFRIAKEARGFIGDGNNGTIEGRWYLEEELGSLGAVPDDSYSIRDRLDSRGDLKVSANLIFAAGRTFRSGYLNVPVNVFVSPRKDGTVVGLSFGFNIQKRSSTSP